MAEREEECPYGFIAWLFRGYATPVHKSMTVCDYARKDKGSRFCEYC